MDVRPTKKQKEMLQFIDAFIKGNGYGPSYREIMRSLDYKSVSTVATHVDGLVARGFLRKGDDGARTLEVVVQHGAQAEKMEWLGRKIQRKIHHLRTESGSTKDIIVLERAADLLGVRL